MASIGEKADCIMVPDVDFLYANPEQMLEGKLGWLANAAFSVEHRLALSLAADLNISWGGVVTQCGFQTRIFNFWIDGFQLLPL